MTDRTPAVHIGEPVTIVATFYLPKEMPDDHVDQIFAVRHGAYNHQHSHPHFAEHSNDFARYFTTCNKPVLAFGMLGIGQSSTDELEIRLDRTQIAAEHAAVPAY